jgi:triosephosphate isomerase
MTRARLVVAVWKEKLTLSQSVAAAHEILKGAMIGRWPFSVALAPNPFSCAAVANIISGSSLHICAQNILWEAQSGSYIGETTAAMLNEVSCQFAIVGHSERRLHFHESNAMVSARALAAIHAGIKPIVCIGDTADDRSKGRSQEVLVEQMRALFEKLPKGISPDSLMVAYEPVWAISTWRSAQPLPTGKEVQDIHSQLRSIIADLVTPDFADRVSLLYGGSVAATNAEEYLAQTDVDGALVGGASVSPTSFLATIASSEKGFKNK